MPTTLTDDSLRILANMQHIAQVATATSAEHLVEWLRQELHGARSGKNYRGHIASAPGEAPATQTGTLERAVQSRPIKNGQEVFVAPEADYAAKYLEFGSPGGRVAPRPFFYSTTEAHLLEYARAIEAALQGSLRG